MQPSDSEETVQPCPLGGSASACDSMFEPRCSGAPMDEPQVASILDHFRRSGERSFSSEERDRVTILFGGFTWKHEKFIEAMFRGSGYRCQRLPTPNLEAFATGKEFGNNGQCNPTYFTVGNLIQFLQGLERQGWTRQRIVDEYLFFTAGSCGPCRFGMYESEYRSALDNAGFTGFRIILYHVDQVTRSASNNPGLKLSLDFNMGALNMLNLGDVIHDMVYQIRPYEIKLGATDRAAEKVTAELSHFLETRRLFELKDRAPAWVTSGLARRPKLRSFANVSGKILTHLYEPAFVEQMWRARAIFDEVEVDRLRVKPLVKITGEFWAQLTEGDGNFQMFAFLEREGAQVQVEGIGGWITYLLHQSCSRMEARKGLDFTHPDARWWQVRTRFADHWRFHRKRILFRAGEGAWNHLHARTARHMGGLTQPLVSQRELARLANPFYNSQARGGEGHLEVAKNIYYSTGRLCHMVLALKPFGCMPSLQSDGVQAAVVSRYPAMNFLSVETSGDGAIHAYSRVQMALEEARRRARSEFDQALQATGKSLEQLRDFVGRHRQLRSPLYPVPRRKGVAGVAANFALHVSDLIDGRARFAVQ